MVDLSLFEKVELEGKKPNTQADVWLYKSPSNQSHSVNISKHLVRLLGWNDGDTLSIYKLGHSFALKRDKYGSVKFKSIGKTASIHSKALYMKLMTVNPGVTQYNAQIEEDVLFLLSPKASD